VRQDKLALLKTLWGSPPPVASTPPPVSGTPPPAVNPPPVVVSPPPVVVNPPPVVVTPPPVVVAPPAPTPPKPPGTTYAQPGIMSFSPATGPVGTVVTLTGTGFTGLNQAWIGAAHNAVVKVISNTQAQVTIPPGATSGSIGLLNPGHAAFTASSFTVTVATAPVVQQHIQDFSPAGGPVGTVVTMNGSGFTGSTMAWIGAARSVPIKVLSDKQLQMTLPAGATTGAIGIFNSSYASFSATSFVVK
jgi:hypothetical protein